MVEAATQALYRQFACDYHYIFSDHERDSRGIFFRSGSVAENILPLLLSMNYSRCQLSRRLRSEDRLRLSFFLLFRIGVDEFALLPLRQILRSTLRNHQWPNVLRGGIPPGPAPECDFLPRVVFYNLVADPSQPKRPLAIR